MTLWETFFDNKIRIIASAPYILDIGGGFKMQKGLSEYKKLFEKSKYVVLDKNQSYGPDMVGDVMSMPQIESSSVDAVICKAVLEHVEEPHRAVDEIYRVLKPGGSCFVYVPFLYSYHAEKGKYGDFYRYTLDGLQWLFRNFDSFEYAPVRGRLETIAYLLPVKILRRFCSRLLRPFDRLFPSEYQSSGYFVFVVK